MAASKSAASDATPPRIAEGVSVPEFDAPDEVPTCRLGVSRIEGVAHRERARRRLHRVAVLEDGSGLQEVAVPVSGADAGHHLGQDRQQRRLTIRQSAAADEAKQSRAVGQEATRPAGEQRDGGDAKRDRPDDGPGSAHARPITPSNTLATGPPATTSADRRRRAAGVDDPAVGRLSARPPDSATLLLRVQQMSPFFRSTRSGPTMSIAKRHPASCPPATCPELMNSQHGGNPEHHGDQQCRSTDLEAVEDLSQQEAERTTDDRHRSDGKCATPPGASRRLRRIGKRVEVGSGRQHEPKIGASSRTRRYRNRPPPSRPRGRAVNRVDRG